MAEAVVAPKCAPEPPIRAGSAARENLRQLVLLRNLAVAGQAITVMVAGRILEIPLPFFALTVAISFLALFNVATWLRLQKNWPVTEQEFFAQLLVDVLVLAFLLYHTGGADNPFKGLFLVPLTITAAYLPWSYTWMLAGFTLAAFTFLMFEHSHVTMADGSPIPRQWMLIAMWINYVVAAVLIAYFVVKIAATLRGHDQALARAKERELNNECLIGLAALAAGAAHELSSPLSTMSVVIKELQHENQDMRDSLDILARQIDACKGTLTNLMAAAGQTRLEGGSKMPVPDFLESIVDKYRVLRPGVPLRTEWTGIQPAPVIVGEQTLRQALMNLLNNAADASPDAVELAADWDRETMRIEIRDRGPGIPTHLAENLGKPFFTTKGPGNGNGLGLFLTNSTINRFGGTVEMFNRPEGGACIRVALPLAQLLVSPV